MSPIEADIISQIAFKNTIVGVSILGLGVTMSLFRIVIPASDGVAKFIAAIVMCGCILAGGGAIVTAQKWDQLHAVFYTSEKQQVFAKPDILPGKEIAVIETEYNRVEIPQEIYEKTQRKFPDQLPEINFGPATKKETMLEGYPTLPNPTP